MEKLLLKIVLAISLFCTSSVYAVDYMQMAEISLDMQNATYEEVFKAIENQTEFTFFYDENVFDSRKKITLKVKNEGITSVLNEMFDKSTISYKITDRHVVLYKRVPERKKNESVTEQQPQQPIVVSGVVSDEIGEPLIGVTVVSSSRKATITDENGRYTLHVDAGEELTFSYVGYVPQKIAARAVLNVQMEPSVTGLEEVVVVAYGQQKKASVTGAISQVSTRELKQSPVANLSASLAGRLPGLTALQISGQPGVDKVNLYLRGVGTTNGNTPLILIDGVPRSNISTLDPNEVASVSILKDASATAVFGVRGANGVILITTKRGQAGEGELSISIDQSMQQFTISPPRVHSWEYAQLRNEAQANAGAAPIYSDYQIARYKDGSDPVFYPDRYPYEEFYRSFAPQTRINANLNGGDLENLTYFVNAGYINQGSNMKTEKQRDLGYDPAFKMDRYNFRGNLDFRATKTLTLSLNLASYLQKVNAPMFYDGDPFKMTQMLQNTITADPTEVGPLTHEGYTTPSGVVVPANEVVGRIGGGIYGTINRLGYREQTQSVLNSSFIADWGLDFLTKGLSTKFMISFDSDANTTLVGSRTFAFYNYSVATAEGGTNYYLDNNNAALVNPNITLDKVMYSNYYMNLQYSVNYARTFGKKHDVTGLLLFQRDNWDSQNGDLPFNVIGLASRFTYAYNNRYYAEVNMGYNGSEQFAPKNRFGFFPAFSAAYVVSDEEFWNKSVVSNLKLRASYGLVGNDKMGDVRFLYDSENSLYNGGVTPSLGRGGVISQGKVGNDVIQWEVAEKQNLGLDLQLWESLSLTVDFFKEHRDKILIQRGLVPSLQGIALGNLPLVNMGIVDNKGFEIELAYVKRFNKDLMVNVRGNYAFARNKVEYFDESPYPEDYACRYRRTGYYVEGHGTHWANRFGYKIDKTNGSGYITTPEELEWAQGAYSWSVTEGDFLYTDINGDGLVDDKDKVLMAYPTVPEISFGFSGVINYKSLDLSFLFSGIANCSMTYPETLYRYSEPAYSHAWTRERWDNGESIQYPALKPENLGASYLPNDFFTFDRSYLRLKTVELGYTLPKDWLKPVGIKSCRIYLNGNNLLTFTKFPLKTIDPEQASAGDFPIQKMYNLGVNVVF
ncbi:MAG: TonB-dependent receptor [Tannerella sp.]|nr:TonB-dependent receptor [Tannerella sp.]